MAQITEVRVRLLEGDGKVKAVASVTFDGQKRTLWRHRRLDDLGRVVIPPDLLWHMGAEGGCWIELLPGPGRTVIMRRAR